MAGPLMPFVFNPLSGTLLEYVASLLGGGLAAGGGYEATQNYTPEWMDPNAAANQFGGMPAQAVAPSPNGPRQGVTGRQATGPAPQTAQQQSAQQATGQAQSVAPMPNTLGSIPPQHYAMPQYQPAPAPMVPGVAEAIIGALMGMPTDASRWARVQEGDVNVQAGK